MATVFRSKIRAAAERARRLGSFGDLGPGRLATEEWRALGLELPDVPRMRRYRLGRLRAELHRADVAGILLYDPINVRYATDSTNMQVWCMHNAVRYAFVATDGPVVLFDYHGSEHLSDHLELIDEVRPALSWIWFYAGPKIPERARRWAAEIAELVRRHGAGCRRLAVDECNREGLDALRELGVEPVEGQGICERARAVKSGDEIRAMRCAIATAEEGMRQMREALRPGIGEQELWAILHRANIERGGEWIETRLLTSGPRTNPWFQECSARVIEAGDLVAFDTDLIGPYGYCADISRTWVTGGRLSPEQRTLYEVAREQIAHNLELLRPGMTLFEFGERAFDLPARYRANRYSSVAHGVGLADEYPHIPYPEDRDRSGYDAEIVPGMTLCLESYVGEEGGHEGVKLEEQVLVTESGCERLSRFDLEPAGAP